MDAPKTHNAVVVGHIDLKPVVKPSHRAQQPPHPSKPQQKREDRPHNPREANVMQLQEMQFIKRQLKSYQKDLLQYDALRAVLSQMIQAVAKAGGFPPATSDVIKLTFEEVKKTLAGNP